ncbi:MAG: hypothetical protein ACKOV8_03920 [Phycisphaerales bacterium]
MSADAPSVERIRSLVAEELPRLVAFRRDLHRHPEVGYEEVRTAGVIVRELAEAGVAHVGGLAGGTGVLAHVPGPGDCAVALRAAIARSTVWESAAGTRAKASAAAARNSVWGTVPGG